MDAPWQHFDAAAERYAAVRPTYPAALFDTLHAYAGRPGSSRHRAVEIGVGTGQATRPLAERGWTVRGLEPGTRLAAQARRALADLPNVVIDTVTFENAQIDTASVDLLAAATSWHWVDPTIGHDKAARMLRDGGTIALWWNAHVNDVADAAWRPVRTAYERVAPSLAVLPPLAPDRPHYDPHAELAAHDGFVDIEAHHFPFRVDYTADELVALVSSYASHQHLDSDVAAQLHDAVRVAVERDLGGTASKPYDALLILGRRRAS